MAVFDVKMMFCDKQDATAAITSDAIDHVADYTNPLHNGHKMALCIAVADIAGTSLAFTLEDSDDGETFAPVMTSKAFTAEELADPIVVGLPFEHRRYLRLVTAPSGITAGTITAWLGNDYKFGHIKEEEGWEFHGEAESASGDTEGTSGDTEGTSGDTEGTTSG